MKLNIGDAGVDAEGYIGWDIARGQDARNITIDGQFEEIRASHVVEHFERAELESTLRHWVSRLRPGGILKIAVPDFKILAETYLRGEEIPIQSYIMGGQTDKHDYHKTIFDEDSGADLLRSVGLVGIRHWQDAIEDSSRYPFSLNLAGTKPHEQWPKAAAVLSVPRLGFNDFWACAVNVLTPLRIPIRKTTGAYWDRDLIAGIESAIDDHQPEWVLTCDYDTVFTRDQVMGLLDLAVRYPHADAIAPLQASRFHGLPMFTAEVEGRVVTRMERGDLEHGEILRSATAHFGLTLLRVSKLLKLPKPWMQRTYGEGGCDPDVQFWRNWTAAGNTVYTALRIPVGHCDLQVRWPDKNLEVIYQSPQEFHKSGPPEKVWR